MSSYHGGESPDIRINNFFYTKTMVNRIEWELRSKLAEYYEGSHYAELTAIDAIFYAEDGREISLTADRGTFDSQSQDMDTEGSVVVITSDGYRLETEKLRYQAEPGLITSPVFVKITGPAFQLEGDELTINVHDETMRLASKVHVQFTDTEALKKESEVIPHGTLSIKKSQRVSNIQHWQSKPIR